MDGGGQVTIAIPRCRKITICAVNGHAVSDIRFCQCFENFRSSGQNYGTSQRFSGRSWRHRPAASLRHTVHLGRGQARVSVRPPRYSSGGCVPSSWKPPWFLSIVWRTVLNRVVASCILLPSAEASRALSRPFTLPDGGHRFPGFSSYRRAVPQHPTHARGGLPGRLQARQGTCGEHVPDCRGGR